MKKIVVSIFAKVELIDDTDGSIYARPTGLKGVHVSGATEQEALDNLQEAIISTIETYNQINEPIPQNEDITIIVKATLTRDLPKPTDTIYDGEYECQYVTFPAYIASSILDNTATQL